MNRISPGALFFSAIILFSVNHAQGQDGNVEKSSRPRSVVAAAREQQQTQQNTTQLPKPAEPTQQVPPVLPKPNPKSENAPSAMQPAPNGTENNRVIAPKLPQPVPAEADSNRAISLKLPLTPVVTMSRISEAQRLLKSRPVTTALTAPSIEFVTVAALEPGTARTHLITFSKQTFLTKGAELAIPSSLGTLVSIKILRANGVNTAMTILTPDGTSLVPLTVEYPIERNGVFREMAYYTSAHPALLSNDLTRSGQGYVRNMLDLAARRLGERGVNVSPALVDIAEKLCIVEHTDHDRFRQENRLGLFNEIYSLYALNELETYKYSVSVAGAGGMVQMIPWAYNLVRQRHPGVGLMPDFVTGMRNHGNALQAMLLYMQDTWNDLAANDDVQFAMSSKIATQAELMAAGYNSNAAKLPGYIRRGGDQWRGLIPRETQMYLQIYKSFDSLVPLKPRVANPTVAKE